MSHRTSDRPAFDVPTLGPCRIRTYIGTTCVTMDSEARKNYDPKESRKWFIDVDCKESMVGAMAESLEEAEKIAKEVDAAGMIIDYPRSGFQS